MVENSKLCIVCHSSDTFTDKKAGSHLSLPQNIKIVKCKRCGLRWLSPIPFTVEYQEMYRSSYFEDMPEDYEKVVAERIIHFRNRIKNIKRCIGKNRIRLLDIGAATGEFMAEAQRSGIEVLGIEPSSSACERAKQKYGIEMIQGDFMGIDLGSSTYDVIHMNHVFEHLSKPQEYLEKVRGILADDGIFVIEVPNQFDNILHIIMRLLGRAQPQPFNIYSIHHPFFYTSRSLGLLLAQHSFKIIKLSTWTRHMKIKSASFYPGASFVEKYILLAGDLIFKGGLFIEVYARKMKKRST